MARKRGERISSEKQSNFDAYQSHQRICRSLHTFPVVVAGVVVEKSSQVAIGTHEKRYMHNEGGEREAYGICDCSKR